ncbi:Uma2 family endonuclease [Candidatus Halobeggiatoa sp. HSG11]|nr:Uma2 family endonuclease [Candidatus Halobeggiatoa sp. HSG11]
MVDEEELKNMGSLNHSFTQARLTALLSSDESSLFPDPMDDMLRVSQMPLLAVEIISTKQSINNILAKFKAYFELGIKSCWLVTPAFESITVYSGYRNFRLFDVRRDMEVDDEVLNIHLQFDRVFRNKVASF